MENLKNPEIDQIGKLNERIDEFNRLKAELGWGQSMFVTRDGIPMDKDPETLEECLMCLPDEVCCQGLMRCYVDLGAPPYVSMVVILIKWVEGTEKAKELIPTVVDTFRKQGIHIPEGVFD